MSNLQERLQELRNDFKQAQREEIESRTRLEESKKNQRAIEKQIKEAGYDPSKLSKIIAKKESELSSLLDEINLALNPEDDSEEMD